MTPRIVRNGLRNGTTWTALATVAIAIFTYLLYGVTSETNRTTQAIQRAYINVGRPEAISPVIENGAVTGIRLSIPWTNSGTTPALKASSRVGWATTPNELQPERNVRINTQDASITAIGPMADINTTATIQIDNWRRAMSGEHLYLMGWTTYQDIFPNTRWRLTEFCYEFSNVTATNDITQPQNTIRWTNTSCPGERSCYDESCPDYEQRIQERLDEDRARDAGLSRP